MSGGGSHWSRQNRLKRVVGVANMSREGGACACCLVAFCVASGEMCTESLSLV